jgi:hypothetical protein
LLIVAVEKAVSWWLEGGKVRRGVASGTEGTKAVGSGRFVKKLQNWIKKAGVFFVKVV